MTRVPIGGWTRHRLMGFDVAAFKPIFVMSRITGWTAHIIEQLQANALI